MDQVTQQVAANAEESASASEELSAQAQQMRAVRLVVDTGIHAKRWTREQAINYMLENTGMPESEVVTRVTV